MTKVIDDLTKQSWEVDLKVDESLNKRLAAIRENDTAVSPQEAIAGIIEGLNDDIDEASMVDPMTANALALANAYRLDRESCLLLLAREAIRIKRDYERRLLRTAMSTPNPPLVVVDGGVSRAVAEELRTGRYGRD